MVPWLAAARPNAPSKTSTIRCDVSTFPPATAGHSSGPFAGRRIEQSLGNDQFNGLKHTLIQRDVFIDKATQAIHHCCGDDRSVRVQIVNTDFGRPGKIDGCLIVTNRDFHFDRSPIV